MAIQVFLGNPSNRVVTWIKSKNEQQQNATIINNTNVLYYSGEMPSSIMLSNDLTSYNIQSQNDIQVPVKAGTYYARINCPTWDDGDEYEADWYSTAVFINNIDSNTLGFSLNSNYHYVNENYVIEQGKTYEFTYGPKIL